MYKNKRVGVGIVTYERPSHFHNCIRSVSENLLDVVDDFIVYNDGSAMEFEERYLWVYANGDFDQERFEVYHARENKSVAHAKNFTMRKLYEAGCDYIFVLEDDQLILSEKAVTAYIDASQSTGIQHFSFAHHGPANATGLMDSYDGIEIYTASIGAWCMYTREVIDTVGYHDEENFGHNAFEHVEYTSRIAKAGLTTPMWRFADIENSKRYIQEQPDALQSSRIRSGANWAYNCNKTMERWREADKETWK